MFKRKKANPTEVKLANTLTSSPIKSAAKEVGLFIGIFSAVFLISIAFVNANLLYHTAKDFFSGVQAAEYTFAKKDTTTNLSTIDDLLATETSETTDAILKQSNASSKNERENSLQARQYNFSYSLVPPEHRIFIPSIGIDAPIVDVTATTEQKLRDGDFMDELYSGVVKYPSTPEPGSIGNTLIFGHTSYYRWKKNSYGEIFAKIIDLQAGATVKIARWGQLYTYEVIETVIVKPKEVDEIYEKYTDGDYITLMGCYPIWSDAKRILVIAKRIPDKAATAVNVQ